MLSNHIDIAFTAEQRDKARLHASRLKGCLVRFARHASSPAARLASLIKRLTNLARQHLDLAAYQAGFFAHPFDLAAYSADLLHIVLTLPHGHPALPEAHRLNHSAYHTRPIDRR